MSDRSDGFGAFVVGLLLGGAAGAITALLLAPQTGEDTGHHGQECSFDALVKKHGL